MKPISLDNETIAAFRSVFKGSNGSAVLTIMLVDLGFFDPVPVDDAEAVALRSYATRLLQYLGISHECRAGSVTQALLKVPPAIFKNNDDSLTGDDDD